MAPAQTLRDPDRVAFLRETIRRLEANPALGGGSAPSRVASGHAGLDSLLKGGLSRGALHDLHARAAADSASVAGFALSLAIRAHASGGKRPLIWIAGEQAGWESGGLYGPGLAAHGLAPDALIQVQTVKLADALWALEEALRSSVPAAVIGEMTGWPKAYDLTASRRLLLAAQASGAFGLLVFSGIGGSGEGASSAAATRFVIASARSRPEPGRAPGRAAWRIEATKNRAGRTGAFSVEWDHDGKIFAEPAPVLRDRLPHPADRSGPAKPSARRFG